MNTPTLEVLVEVNKAEFFEDLFVAPLTDDEISLISGGTGIVNTI